MLISHGSPIAEPRPTNRAARPGAVRRPVHVVHLVMALNVGGLERVVIDLVRRTDPARFRTTVLCLKERGTLADQIEAAGVPVVSLECGKRGLGTVLYRLARCLNRLRPDVLHTHNPHPHFVGSVTATLLALPVVINTKHGRNKPERRDAVFANRIASLLSNTIVAVSTDASNVATQIERVSRRKLQTIHNGIDLTRFRFTEQSSRTGPIRAIHVARLNVVKDQKTLLEAVRLVVNLEPTFQLTIVGDGPLREELHALRARLNLQNHVTFLGERTDVHAMLSEADLFLLSSLKEGLSITLLEAMATGLAVVATDVGGNREVVAPGKTGLLVPSQSPERFAEAILEMFRHPERVREMGRSGRALVEQRFSLDQTVRQYENLYETFTQSAQSRY